MLTESEKLKLITEAINILESNCIVLGIDIQSLSPEITQLAIKQFVEGVSYWRLRDLKMQSTDLN